MRQSRQGVRSTMVPDEDAMLEFTPAPGVKKKDVYLRVVNADKRSMYTDRNRVRFRASRVAAINTSWWQWS